MDPNVRYSLDFVLGLCSVALPWAQITDWISGLLFRNTSASVRGDPDNWPRMGSPSSFRHCTFGELHAKVLAFAAIFERETLCLQNSVNWTLLAIFSEQIKTTAAMSANGEIGVFSVFPPKGSSYDSHPQRRVPLSPCRSPVKKVHTAPEENRSNTRHTEEGERTQFGCMDSLT